ncbi:hypothetical protein EGI22_01195 [Lacihabitans sp. LS3-19]|uniref:3-coathanger stack domain-containing protein n=1 Tax=Lacihabitans sp. LS3-19 TaxID=2487335 RepID=UPI0020CBC694|nr:3-coathanger stack domain-containing protein [Lacihabitans sp. LS3-19]MCP9766503.1 hypothetical protein [Lacihabitans sp. LS3-19]
MKTKLFFLLIICSQVLGQQLPSKISGANSYFKLEETKNHELNRMTTFKRFSLSNIKNGYEVFDTELNKFFFWNGKDWVLTQSKSELKLSERLDESDLQFSIAAICADNNVCGDGGGGSGGGNTLFPPNITATNVFICSNVGGGNPTNTTLTANGCRAAEKVQWYFGADIPLGSPTLIRTKTVNPSNTTTYFATCVSPYNFNFESNRSNKITISKIETLPTPIASAFPPIINAGNYVTLNAQGCPIGSNYSWANGVGVGDNVVKNPLETTTYSVACKKEVCKGNSANLVVTVLQPLVTASSDSICYDLGTQTSNSVTLTLSNCSSSIIWSNGETTQSINIEPSESAIYYASCAIPGGNYVYSNLKSIHVSKSPIIQKNVGTNNDFVLTAACQSGYSVLWSTSETTPSISVPDNIFVEYFAFCIFNNCFSKPTKIKINAAPVISASKPVVCYGQNLTLTATGCTGTVFWYRKDNNISGYSFVSSSNPYSSTIPLGFVSAYSYKATCIDVTASPYSNEITIPIQSGTIPPSPTISISPIGGIINLGKNVTLSSSGCTGNTTFWSTGENIKQITKTPDITTTYYSYCYAGSGCPSNSAIKTVTVVNVPPPVVSSVNNKVCSGQNTDLLATGCNGTVQWYFKPQNNPSSPFILAGSTNPLNIPISESYIFKSECHDLGVISDFSDDLIIEFSPNPVVINLTDSELSYAAIFINESVELQASGCQSGDTYLWNTNETTSSIVVSPLIETTYIAKCVNNSCITNGKDYFVKVCPDVQSFFSPGNNFGSTPSSQPSPSKVILANNTIKNIGTKVEYQASESLLFQPGFQVDSGSIFLAQIGGCKVPSDTLP